MATYGTVKFRPAAFAFFGNGIVTIIKFIAASASGSSSMFSEAVHSLADTLNQVLLLIGVQRSFKKADDNFEYGYGNELSFWALISACGIFFIGAGITGYRGISAFIAPHPIQISGMVFIVLLVAFVVELYTLKVASDQLIRHFPRSSWKKRIAHADPSTLAVILEDTVAVLGVIIAFISIGLSYYTGSSMWDALGSIIISALLGVVAIVLIMKNRSYLLGRAIPEGLQEEIEEALLHEPAIEKVIDFKSAVLGFGVYRIKCEVEFNGGALLSEAYQQSALRDQYEEVRNDYEAFKRFCAEYADRIPRLMGRKIDEIESRIKKLHPGIRHIDIEIN
jgi:zinc transporter 9